ncbi:MAG: hypothetical protein K0S32_4357 [Bacteroidetes bacterium]|jgi:hypothetical protein|nr:hypothetical protein [Bacteroidota bacterium]
MKINILIIFLISIGFSSCQGVSDNSFNEGDYKKFKKKFPKELIKYFPSDVSSENYHISCSTDTSSHNIGLVLYEYDTDIKEINNLKKQLESLKPIAIYTGKDSCLLVVNRYEVDPTISAPNATISTNRYFDEKCLENKYPIPNFIDYRTDEVPLGILKLKPDFQIFVLSANKEKIFKEFKTSPFSEMPENWKNGYSVGIAYSEKEKAIIYWGITW